MQLKLQGSNVLLKRLPPEGSVHKQSEILILPDSTGIGGAWMQYDSFECEVLAIGPGEILEDGSREPLGIEVGDIVIVPQGHGDGTSLPDDSFIVDISAVEAKVNGHQNR